VQYGDTCYNYSKSKYYTHDCKEPRKKFEKFDLGTKFDRRINVEKRYNP
jgi:hypothetical protein